MQTDHILLILTAHVQLATRVGEILSSSSIAHQLEDCLVKIPTSTLSVCHSVVRLLHQNLEPAERKVIKISSNSTAQILSVPDIDDYLEIAETAWFDDAMAQDQFSVYFQPIFDISIGKPVAYECLIRLQSDRFYNGEEIVSAALLRGEILTFDTYARNKAIRSAAGQPNVGTKLFINLFPSAIPDPALCLDATLHAVQDAGFHPSDVVFEIVEYDSRTTMEHTRRICEFFRSQGFLYAIDDFGVGNNQLESIRILQPNYVKIDKSVVWKLQDREAQRLVQDALQASKEVGAEVIAEGIETSEQTEIIRALGIRLMQGFRLGRPSPQMNEGPTLKEPDPQMMRDLMLLSSAVATTTNTATTTTSFSDRESKERVRVASLRNRRIRP